jgi:uncharacterized protein YdeI (YjbR/CyaY-like superfamily)
MAPIKPDPKKIRSFRTEAAFATWLGANHDRETELWLKFHKKDSGVPTVTCAQALDVALCWGMRTPAGRAKKIAALVATLARGQAIVPERRR